MTKCYLAERSTRAANFPVTKTLEEFDLVASSIEKATFDHRGTRSRGRSMPAQRAALHLR